MKLDKFSMLSLPAIALALQACATVPAEDVAAVAPETTTIGEGPALWKLADDDTTVYLFGTVHALPKEVEWFNGTISNALDASGELVTEIPEMDEAATANMQQVTMSKGMLTDGTTLRSKLTNEQRTQYEAALAKIGVPPAAFDPFEPWMAGITLAVMPLIQAGYDPESGVETVIEAKAAGKTRTALESVDYQIGILDNLPEQSQVDFLMAGVEYIDKLVPMLDQIVAEWAVGDIDDMAELVFASAGDDELVADAIFYKRNRNWAEWIGERMDAPGTVFIAVGAGHLVGDKSVQVYLKERGMSVSRVQ